MRALPVLGVAVVAVLIGGGLYYLQDQPSSVPVAVTIPSPSTTQAQNVSFRVLESGSHTAKVTTAKNYAAYSQAGLMRLWDLVHDTDGTVPPNVDFAKEYVIGIFGGQKPTGGYSVAATSVTDGASNRTIAVMRTSPGTGCITNQMVTSPYQIIAVPISDLALSHTDTENSTPCK